jgi:hypothetical protein
MDLLVEQVKMLAGEIAFGTSTLKRLVDQSMNDPENSKTQVKILLYLSRELYTSMTVVSLISSFNPENQKMHLQMLNFISIPL